MSTTKAWSATDSYSFSPTHVVWDELNSKNIFTYNNHDLANLDVVQLVPADAVASPGWSQTNVTITLIDANHFSTPQVANPGPVPGGVFSGAINNNQLRVTCMTYSRLLTRPTIIQGNALPAATTIVIEGKVHPEAAWVPIATKTIADGAFGVTISPPYEMVRGRRSVGTGQPVLFAQY